MGEIAQVSEMILGETREYALFGEDETLEEIERARANLERAIEAYAGTEREEEAETAQEDRVLEEIEAALAGLEEKSAAMLELVDQGVETEELEEAGEELEEAERALTSAMAEARNVSDAEVAETIEAVEAAVNRTQILLIVVPLGILLLISAAFFLLHRSITIRLQRLTRMAQVITAGNREERVVVDSKDELGLLGTSLNQMTDQLQATVDTLEQRVAERTRRLELVVALGERLDVILDVDRMLSELVNQVQINFGYYHVQVFLMDENRENLVASIGTGEIGQTFQ
ncbi:MAG: HAMP domain-containing protein, partial [Proteobacteria bacterium]|nr:HAMP domain-containing protein [Pseudomonadota bacterium]